MVTPNRSTRQLASEAATKLLEAIEIKPRIAMLLGTGHTSIANQLKDKYTFSQEELPGGLHFDRKESQPLLFGHFEEHKSKLRRTLKFVLVSILFVSVSATMGRPWAFGLLALPLAAALVIHAWWLPRNGVNGWTGEPKEKYYELIGHKKKGF